MSNFLQLLNVHEHPNHLWSLALTWSFQNPVIRARVFRSHEKLHNLLLIIINLFIINLLAYLIARSDELI